MKNPLIPGLLAVLLAGCSTTKPATKPAAEEKIHQRGWIGGEFKLARKTSLRLNPFGPREGFIAAFPRGLANSNRAGLFITALSTNAPAHQAGLRAGDLVIAFNHQPVSTLKAFWQCLDRAEPGTSLPIEAW